MNFGHALSICLLAVAANWSATTFAGEIGEFTGDVEALRKLRPLPLEFGENIHQPSDLSSDRKGFSSRAQFKQWMDARVDPELDLEGAWTYQEVLDTLQIGALQTAKVVMFHGEIKNGDADKIAKYLEETNFFECLRPGYCPYNNILAVDSIGGSYAEAIKIAKYVRDNDIPILVPDGASCESACSLVFFSAWSNYNGHFFPRRFAHLNSNIGLQRPSIRLPDKLYTGIEMSNMTDYLSSSFGDVVDIYTSSKIKIRTLGKMFSTLPENMYYMNNLEKKHDGIWVLGRKKAAISDLNDLDAIKWCAEKLSIGNNDYMNENYIYNFQMNKRIFITYDFAGNNVCFGLKDGYGWRAVNSTCVFLMCPLKFLSQLPAGRVDPDYEDIAVDFDNTEVGLALQTNAYHPKFLDYLYESNTRPDDELGNSQIFGVPELEYLYDYEIPTYIDPRYCGGEPHLRPQGTKIIQSKLKDIGLYGGEIDGVIGKKTRKALEALNQKHLNVQTDNVKRSVLKHLEIPEQKVFYVGLCR